MKLGPIEFPPFLLDALRDGKLAIFAGAGVSMGNPSSLPSFEDLADKITGKKRPENEPIDRFLGGLARSGVKVHQRTKEILSRSDSTANDLHRDLLRLFRSSGQVRLVTTNFDLHFESAAQSIFTEPPDIYSAPALPLGRKFNGIAHVHGSLARHDDMVLTDTDFGRAYLTEGWARRFLVDVFREFTILFIGYSHTDTVMNYLARALPEGDLDKRFALVASDADNMAHWEWLGIQPIVFPKESPSDYSK